MMPGFQQKEQRDGDSQKKKDERGTWKIRKNQKKNQTRKEEEKREKA